MVFDGVMPHIAGARRGEFNHRFAQPSDATLQGPGVLFPFTDDEQVDPVTEQRDGLLCRLMRTGHCPKIVYTNTSAEYWRGDASLSHISVDDTTDVTLPETVRLYLFAGTQHGPGRLPLSNTAEGARGQYPLNSVDYTPLLRAILVHLDRWVSHNEPPPPSRYPRLAESTAVPAQSLAVLFQCLPGKAFPALIPQPQRLDFGPAWEHGVASWLPPRLGEPYKTFVPAVDGDGNEVAGIRLPDLTVPLATYTGWNPRHASQGAPSNRCVCMALRSRLRQRRVSVSNPMMCDYLSLSAMPLWKSIASECARLLRRSLLKAISCQPILRNRATGYLAL